MDTAIVRAWVDGWILSRGAAPVIEEPWGFTVDVGFPKPLTRHILPEANEAVVRKLTETITASNTWLKTFVPAETIAPWLAPGWTITDPGYMMSVTLAHSTFSVPDGYHLRTWTHGAVTRALVRSATGAFAARGIIACSPGTQNGVVDQILTDPAHQRKGLGSLVMKVLSNTAIEAGARTGILGASVEGQALYESLGWQTLGPLTSILLPGEDA